MITIREDALKSYIFMLDTVIEEVSDYYHYGNTVRCFRVDVGEYFE
jgi:hypothetical protein